MKHDSTCYLMGQSEMLQSLVKRATDSTRQSRGAGRATEGTLCTEPQRTAGLLSGQIGKGHSSRINLRGQDQECKGALSSAAMMEGTVGLTFRSVFASSTWAGDAGCLFV